MAEASWAARKISCLSRQYAFYPAKVHDGGDQTLRLVATTSKDNCIRSICEPQAATQTPDNL